MNICTQCGKHFDDTVETCPDDYSKLISVNLSGSDPLLGKVLAGRFLIIEKLGEGGMGAVYKAVHNQMGRVCAIKLLSPATQDSDSSIARFIREARMASRIDNPHAITIYDFGKAQDGLLYLAMEYVDGKMLSQILAQERPLGNERVARIAAQIAEGLAAAHAIGIVHRDLKPDNIMIARKGAGAEHVKVLDFGIAKTVADNAADNLTKTGFVLGTPVYMSPEQLSGEKLDARSDIYSFAIIVYEMLSGLLPFEGDSMQSIMIKRITTNPVPLRVAAPSISEAVEQVVMAGLARNPQERTPTIEAFASALKAALDSSTQRIGDRATDEISDTRDRATIPVSSNRATNLDSGPFPVEKETITPPGGLAIQDNDVTRALVSEQNKAAAPESKPPAFPSPSAFVTQPSTRLPIAGQSSSGQTGPAVNPVINNAAHADSFQSEQTKQDPLTSTAGQADERQVADSPQYPSAQPATLAPEQLKTTRMQSSKGSLIAAMSVAALVIIIVAGYFLYKSRSEPTIISSTATEATKAGGPEKPDAQPSPSDRDAAKKHYESGRKRQEQAYLLADEGKNNAEAKEENHKAIAEYLQAVALQPSFPEAHENLAVALYNVGQLEEAVDEYKIAIRQYDKQPTSKVFTNYGLALFDLKRYREAANAFGRALELDPSDSELYAHRGFALENAGDRSSAEADYKAYLRLEPEGQYASAIKQILARRAQPPTESGNQ